MTWLWVAIAVVLDGAVALVGGLLPERWLDRYQPAMLGFAAGTLLASGLGEILPHAISSSGVTALGWTISAMLVLGAFEHVSARRERQAGPVPAVHPKDREELKPGHIYVAPPDRHMLVVGKLVRLSHGPKENMSRPAIDPLFRTAATAYGAGAVGVVLTGQLDDGTAGLLAIKDRGGIAIVQDPHEATAASMPRRALRHVAVDHICKIAELPSLLAELAKDPPARRLHGGRLVGPRARELAIAAELPRLPLLAVRDRRQACRPIPVSVRPCLLGRELAGRPGDRARDLARLDLRHAARGSCACRAAERVARRHRRRRACHPSPRTRSSPARRRRAGERVDAHDIWPRRSGAVR